MFRPDLLIEVTELGYGCHRSVHDDGGGGSSDVDDNRVKRSEAIFNSDYVGRSGRASSRHYGTRS